MKKFLTPEEWRGHGKIESDRRWEEYKKKKCLKIQVKNKV